MREIYFRLARRVTPVLEVEAGGSRFLVSTSDHGVGMTLFMGEDAERETLESVRDALSAHGAPSPTGRTLVDVGANIGTSAVGAIAELGMARAICLEPLPENLRLLRHNLLANGLSDRAEVLDVALSDSSGSVDFEIHPGNPSDARVRIDSPAAEADSYGESGWETVTVRTATFDELVAEGEIPLEEVGLVWIDAQGHEGHILSGAETLVGSAVPVVIEFWPYGLRRSGGFDRLLGLIEKRYESVVDLESGAVMRPAEARALAGSLGHTGQTDLLLLK